MKTKVLSILLLLFIHQQVFSQKYLEIIRNSKTNDFKEIVEEIEKYYENRDKGKGSGWKQYQRWKEFNAPRLSPDGKVVNLAEKEIKDINAYKARRSSQKLAAVGAFSGNWKPKGPYSQKSTNPMSPYDGVGVGRVNRLAFDPSNSNIIYAGVPNGGLWRTTTGGNSWTCLTDVFPSVMGVSSVVIDPSSPAANRTIYALTGDADGSGYNSIGLIKSTDNGTSWVQTSFQTRGSKIMMHPSNPGILFIVGENGIYKSTNAGASWVKKLDAPSGFVFSYPYRDMEFKPNDPNTIYVSAANGSIMRSVNNGETWTAITSGLPVFSYRQTELAVTPANPNYVYVFYQEGESGFGIYLSTDAGLTYSLKSTPYINTQYGYDQVIAASPTNANEVYIGGVRLSKSTNGGTSFVEIAPAVHVDFHDLVFVGNTLYAANDGGVFKSTDNGANWTDLSSGLNITMFYKIGLDPNDPSRVVGGSQDNGGSIIKNQSADRWHTGDGMECFVDPTNPSIIYGSAQNCVLFKSYDNGVTSMWLHTDPASPWTVPFLMDPNNPKVLYLGKKKVYRSTDGGSSWNSFESGPNTGQNIGCIVVAPSNSNYIYSSIDFDAGIYMTADAGVTWTNISAGLNGQLIKTIAVHPTNPLIACVTVINANTGSKVFRTTDGGATWSDYTGSLSTRQIPANCLVYEKGTNGLYVGMDGAIYYRGEGMSDWVEFSTGLPHVPVNEMEIHYGSRRIVAATYGRGIWESPLYADGAGASVAIMSAGTPEEERANGTFIISGNNITANTTVTYTIGGTASSADYTASPSLSGTVTLTPSQPSVTITITPLNDPSMEGNETLQLTLTSGTGYIISQETATLTIKDNDIGGCPGTTIAYTSTAPVIDQTVDAAWNNTSSGTLNNVTVGSMPSDFAGSKWRALYDNNKLYLLVEVNDNSKRNDSGGNWWEDDVVEVFVDGNNSKGTSYDGVNDFQWAFRWNDAAIKVGGNSVNNTTGISFAMHTLANGYNLEVSIPWTTIGVTPTNGKLIGFDIAVDDDDNGGARDGQVSAFATVADAYQNPSRFGTVTLCAGSAPQIVSSLTTRGIYKASFTYAIKATEGPISYNATGLPAGLSINTTTGVISGTPTVTGVWNVSISANNGSATVTKTLRLTIDGLAPRIINTTQLMGNQGVPLTYQIQAENFPTSFSATGMLEGLTLNTTTGVISGTPVNQTSVFGQTYINITATNEFGISTDRIPVIIRASNYPVISSPMFVETQVGASFTYTITASASPTTFTCGDLPSGLSFNASTGVISGTPLVAGTYNVSVTAANATGTDFRSINIKVYSSSARVPVIVSSSTASVEIDSYLYFQVQATNSPTVYTINFLPEGLTWNSLTGVLSGIPVYPGEYGLQISAGNDAGYGNQYFMLTVNAKAKPDINSNLLAGGWVGVAFKYAITGTNTPTSFNATGLPAGLSINTVSGVISGTPTSTGTTNVTISATNSYGTDTKTLSLTVDPNPTPVINSSLTASGSVGTWFTYTITASNFPTSYNATPLPAGLSINTSSGLISGTPTATGTTNVSISATNFAGTNTKTLVITIGSNIPQINSALTKSGVIGTAFSYTITASNSPTSFNASPLPAGLSINTSTGVISGTPTATGTTNVSISATNSFGSDTKTLVVTITNAIPQITSALTKSGVVGTAFSYTITATNNPTSFNATPLPAGLSINTSTGVISGTPTAAGTTNVSISATNSGGTDTKTLVVTITNAVPQINSALTKSGVVGTALSYTITATNNPTSFNATPLPAGLSINTSTGVISGTPTAAGTTNVSISATNSAGTDTKTLVVTITNAPPQINSALTKSGVVGTAFSYTITANNNPTSFNATPLPAGLSINTSTGVISGTPTAAGTTNVSISATNSAGTDTKTLVVTITSVQPPVISSALTASATTGTAFSYSITASNSPTSYNATSLPIGLSVNTSTGVISGTPSVPGTTSVTISATNAAGTDSKVLTLTVSDPSGVITCLRAPGTITVNGSLTETGWNVTRAISKNTIGTSNNAATFGVLWDNTNLYIGAKVLDGNLYSESANMWEDDAVEIYIDANYNKLTTYDGRDNQIIKGYNKTSVFTKLSIAGLQHAWTSVTGGYSIEIAIPWSELAISAPASGTNIGFDIGFDDDDNGGGRESQAVWNGLVDNYANTSGFGRLTLSGQTSPAAKLAQSTTSTEVFINPMPVTKGTITVKATGLEGEVVVQVRNMQGIVLYRGMHSAVDSEIELNVSGYTAGTYLLHLQAPAVQVNEKFIVE